jgi:chaperonin GroES
MKIKPQNERMFVVRIRENEETTGGIIIILEKSKEKPQVVKMAAVGSGKGDEKGKRISLEIKKCDHVLFGKYAGNDIKTDVVEYLITSEDDILDIIEN